MLKQDWITFLQGTIHRLRQGGGITVISKFWPVEIGSLRDYRLGIIPIQPLRKKRDFTGYLAP